MSLTRNPLAPARSAPSRSARNHLLWLARSQGIHAGRVDEVIALAGLESAARRKAGGYSLGMRQRLGIAAALLGDPAVLIFDEPFNGMDPEVIVWMKGFLRSLAARGRAVLVSSHLMSELETLFTEGGAGHLVVVGRGKVIADTSVTELIAAASGNRITLRTTAPADAMTVLASDGAEVTATASGALTISNLSSERVVATLTGHAIPFSEVTAHRATLEQAYIELTSQSVEYRAEATS
jgi:ABC-2 type transport system ATP-binding protein